MIRIAKENENCYRRNHNDIYHPVLRFAIGWIEVAQSNLRSRTNDSIASITLHISKFSTVVVLLKFQKTHSSNA